MKTGDKSEVTMMIYLNDGMVGGETKFYASANHAFLQPPAPYLSVRPKMGMALVFLHAIWHEDAVVQSGLKYLLRTDVLYGLHSAESRQG